MGTASRESGQALDQAPVLPLGAQAATGPWLALALTFGQPALLGSEPCRAPFGSVSSPWPRARAEEGTLRVAGLRAATADTRTQLPVDSPRDESLEDVAAPRIQSTPVLVQETEWGPVGHRKNQDGVEAR